MRYVVFGATGYIGSCLFGQLQKDGIPVLGTSRAEACLGERMVRYDISKDAPACVLASISLASGRANSAWTPSEMVSEPATGLSAADGVTAIVCIAESNIDRCLERYSDAYLVNVTRTKELIHALSVEGFRVIFFSSDNVFDGRQGNYTEESKRDPVNKYGMMKKEMEDYLLSHEPEVCILRIPKVVSALRTRQNVFSEWTEGIKAGSIRCIKGNRLSFVSMEDICRACRIVAETGMKGLYQIAGDRAYSRAELARMFYRQMNVDTVEILEWDVEEFPFKDKRALDVSMSNARFRRETGYRFEPMESVIGKYVKNLNDSPASK